MASAFGDSMRLEKSVQLLKLAHMMQSTIEGVGLQEIREEFKVSRSTAARMRNAVIYAFPHVEETRIDGKTKRWRLPSNTVAGSLNISAQDLAGMKTAIYLLRKEGLYQHADSLEQLWLKSKGRLRPENAASIETDLEALLEAESHAMRPGPRQRINTDVLHILREAIKGFRKVWMTYKGIDNGNIAKLLVHPYGFIYGQPHHLIAWCEDARKFRAFSLPGIAATFMSKVHYRKDPTFNIKKFAERSFGACHEEPYDVLWRFSSTVADSVHAHHFHPSQKIEVQPDGRLLVRFRAGGQRDMCLHVMSWDGEAEILEPAHLRQSYKEMAQNLHNKVRAVK
jgi:predicted DNA-binding transcriptional regulator YafY